MKYRESHPGPSSEKSFRFWKRNGGKDRPDFVWPKKENKIKKIEKEKIINKVNKIYKNNFKSIKNVHFS